MINVVRRTMKVWSGGSMITIDDHRWGMADRELRRTESNTAECAVACGSVMGKGADVREAVESSVSDNETEEGAYLSNGTNTYTATADEGQPRLLMVYRSKVVTEALRLAQSRARAQISMLYRNVRNWRLYYDEHFFRMAAWGKAGKGKAVSLLDIASGYNYGMD
ncbi:hypothetical protein PCURB6_11610 [Paenibacillus curdlanolyticus]|nr:hypothetical protein PCURB6_11610 [Paenibacillus curdlanolyticus]